MVIITLPAYNEEESLPLLLERVEESMGEDDTEYRVIVVNDGSTDGTAAVTDAPRTHRRARRPPSASSTSSRLRAT